MFCANCGKKIGENQKFCGNCGAMNPNYKNNDDLRNIVSSAAQGNEIAMEKIYNLTYRQGFAIALQMVKNEQDAMDLMQDAYLSAFKNLSKIEKPEKLKSWFNCIVANKCRDWLKKKKPQLFSDIAMEDDDREFEETIADERVTFSPENSIDYSETKRLMKAILDSLPEDQKLCVLMYYYEELSVGEIAEALECSTGTVKSRLNYARKKIKNDVEELEKKGTKLYSIAPIPFILWMLRTSEEELSIPKEFGKNIAKNVAGENIKANINGEKRKAAEEVVKKGAKESAKKVVGKALRKKIIAGIAGVAVVGGAFAGYEVYQHTLENGNPESVVTSEKKKDASEKSKNEKKEEIEEFTLTDEQINEIEQVSAWFDYLQKEQDGFTTRKNYTLTMEKNNLPEDVIKEVADGIICTDDSIGEEAGEGDFLEIQETLRTEECIDLLKNTFGYDAKDENDVKKFFTQKEEDSFIFEKAPSGSADTIYETKRFAQTGKDEYHFYTEVKPYGDFGYNVAGVMDITAHKNEKSKIGGFVFDKIEFITDDLSNSSALVENIVADMLRAKEEKSGEVDYIRRGSYDVNQLSNQEFLTYANLVMNQADCLKNERTMIKSEMDTYGADSLSQSTYDDFCKNTLGRSEEYNILEVNEIENGNVRFVGQRYDALYVVEDAQIFQSYDGNVKVKGNLKYYAGGEQQKAFIATGYANKNSRIGIVIDKIQIEEEKVVNLDEEQIKKIELAARIFDEFQREQNIYERTDYSLEIEKDNMSSDEWKNVVAGIVCTDDSIGEFVMNDEDGDRVEKLNVSECQKLLKNTFGYNVKSDKELENIFELNNDSTITLKHKGAEKMKVEYNGVSYEVYKVVQISENAYRFYVYVSSAFRVGQPLAMEGTMEIIGHKNEKSIISGFIFDSIDFKAYENGKMNYE